MTEPLTSKERGQWFLHQVADKKGIRNLAASCRFARPLRWWPAQEAVRLLVTRHSVLRQNFPATAGTPTRRITPVAGHTATLEVIGRLGELLGWRRQSSRPLRMVTVPKTGRWLLERDPAPVADLLSDLLNNGEFGPAG
jgi:hypothetical protein